MSKFRILSLDGGGIRGAYSASVLAEIQSNIEGNLAEYFDLITGTSTGGILAIGLGLGLSPHDLLDFYKHDGSRIFPVTGVFGGILGMARQALGVAYRADALQSSLKAVFKNKTFGESNRPLVITSYNASRDGLHLFKTSHHSDHTRHIHLKAVDIAMATAAAPLFFESRQLPLGQDGEDQIFIDGGVCANCPVMCGIVEAIRYFGKALDELEVVSIGTTYAPFQIRDHERRAGVLRWNRRLLTMLLSAQESSAVGTARTLLGEERFHRITQATDKMISLDDTGRLEDLVEWGREDARKWLGKLRERIFSTGPGIVPAPTR